MGIIARLIDFLLYSNIWIAGSAAALYYYSKFVFQDNLTFDLVGIFVFCTCTWLYSLHRYIGLQRVKKLDTENRFFKIQALQKPIGIIAALALVLSVILFFFLTWTQVMVLVLPGALSLLYVLPILNNQKRLRDIHFIKIFIIALVWTCLTVLLPYTNCLNCHIHSTTALLFVERFIFVFAITLPFDIRDLEIDKTQNVKTIPALLGLKFTWLLSFLLLGISSVIFAILYLNGSVGVLILWIHLATNLLALISIAIAFWRRHDWYYTGLIDGTMYLPLLFLLRLMF